MHKEEVVEGKCKLVLLSDLGIFIILLYPLFNNKLNISKFPFRHAKCKGVSPSFLVLIVKSALYYFQFEWILFL